MDLIRDPLWQFIGAVLAVMAILVSIALFFFQKRNKRLTYEIISLTPVLSASEEIAGKLQILLNGEAVRKVHLLVLSLANTGNVPIKSADYEREVSILFNNCEKILSAEVSETIPAKLFAEISTNGKGVSLKPLLLNPGDSISIKFLISGFENSIEIDGRVVGVKAIERKTDISSWEYVALVGFILFSLGIIITFPTIIQKNPGAVVVAIFGYLLMGYGMLGNKERRKRFFREISF